LDVCPGAKLRLDQVYGGLDQLGRFLFTDPDNFEARLSAAMFNPYKITWPHGPGNPWQQSATIAKPGGHNILCERVPTFVDAVDIYNEAFISSRLTAMFHTVQKARLVGNNWPQYRTMSSTNESREQPTQSSSRYEIREKIARWMVVYQNRRHQSKPGQWVDIAVYRQLTIECLISN
jgi:hypothetical protein